MNSGCGYEDSKHSQIFVGGSVSGCKTAVLSKDYKTYPMLTIKLLMFTTLILAFSDLRKVTVKDVMDLLAARRLIDPIQIERYSLGYGGWRRTARLVPATKLFDIGVESNSMLTLSWSVRGFGRKEGEPISVSSFLASIDRAILGHYKSVAGTTPRPNLAYVLVPEVPFKTAYFHALSSAGPSGPSHARATALSRTHSQVGMALFFA